MIVSIIGSNGLLSRTFSNYCHKNDIVLKIYGRQVPVGDRYSKFVQVDLIKDKLDFVTLSESDVIIYTAGAGIQSNVFHSSEDIELLNTIVPISIFNELNKLNFKGILVTFGSYFEIGVNNQDILFDEEMVIHSIYDSVNDYTTSKRKLTSFIACHKFSFTNYHFILPTIYGEIESRHRLIPYTIDSLRKNDDLNFTSGNQVRQYIYVGEIPQIIFQSIKYKLEKGIYNISGRETLTVKQLVELIHSTLGKPLNDEIFGTAKREDTGMMNLQLDGSLLRNKIYFEPVVRIVDIINMY